MSDPIYFHHLLAHSAEQFADKTALIHNNREFTYADLVEITAQLVTQLSTLELNSGDRVAIFVSKSPLSVCLMMAVSQVGCVFIPLNPQLKSAQVQHIVADSGARLLILDEPRYKFFDNGELENAVSVALADCKTDSITIKHQGTCSDSAEYSMASTKPLAALLYTSGSTGMPKGVMLTHQNLILGAESVAQYLENSSNDIILSVLPLSFDYGLSQITCAFLTGASVVLIDYLLPNDIIRAIVRHKVTGLAAVPPIWNLIGRLSWPADTPHSLRYFTNSGGAMPLPTLDALRKLFPDAKPFLMYGLTEAFRSTYLAPDKIDERIGSMGKAIPNARISVRRADGTECNAGEEGELVHAGPLVSQGYWNAPELTASKFRFANDPQSEDEVWSGDIVKTDEDGYLYFVARKDEQIKCLGNRISPIELEKACMDASTDVLEAFATGIKDELMGEAIALWLMVNPTSTVVEDDIKKHLKHALPPYMQPKWLKLVEHFPLNPNGKIDRSKLKQLAKEEYL